MSRLFLQDQDLLLKTTTLHFKIKTTPLVFEESQDQDPSTKVSRLYL